MDNERDKVHVGVGHLGVKKCKDRVGVLHDGGRLVEKEREHLGRVVYQIRVLALVHQRLHAPTLARQDRHLGSAQYIYRWVEIGAQGQRIVW